MSKMFYSGGPGTGKTKHLIDCYNAQKKDSTFTTNGYFVLPTGEQVERVRSIVLDQINPLINDNITTLDGFMRRFIEQRIISEIEKQAILRNICLESNLAFFSKVLDFGVFYERLSALIAEFSHQEISPELLDKILKNKHPEKIAELVLIYQKYLNYLNENKVCDQESLYPHFLEILKNKPLALSFFIIDGFNDFTPLQKKVISLIIANTKTFAGSILFDQHKHFLIPEQQTRDFFLNNNLVETPLNENKRKSTAHDIALLTADNRLMEIEHIAREILLIKDKNNNNWSDIAVIFRQIGGYKDLLQEAFRYYDIPVTIHEGIYLHHNKFIAWLMQLFELFTNDFERDTLLAFIKSAYSSAPKDEVNHFELKIMQNNIWQGEAEWLKSAEEYPTLNTYLKTVFGYTTQLATATTFKQYRETIEEFVKNEKCLEQIEKDVQFPELINSAREALRAYDKLISTLFELENLQFSEKINLFQLLSDVLTQQMTTVKERPANQVQVYDIMIGRQKEYKVVFVANLTMNSFPVKIAENIFLRDEERKLLNLRLTTDKLFTEDALFYQATNRSTEHLYLTYANHEANGQKLSPSYYIHDLEAAQPNLPHKHKSFTDSIPGLDKILAAQEYKEAIIYQLFQTNSVDTVSQVVANNQDLQFIKTIIEKKNDPEKTRVFQTAASAHLSQQNSFGVTALLEYSRCPFAFFCTYILKLSIPELDDYHMQRGNIIHDCLETYYNPLEKNTLNISQLFAEKFPEANLSAIFPQLHPRQLELETTKINNILNLFISAEDYLIKARRTTVKTTEEKFAYTIHDKYTLKGKIDRVDNCAEANLIIDYKTGELPSTGLADLENGILSQLLVYALAYQNCAGAEYRQIKTLKSKGIYKKEYAPQLNVSSRSTAESGEFEDYLTRTRKLLIDYFSAIQKGDFYTVRKCNPYCQYKYICRLNP